MATVDRFANKQLMISRSGVRPDNGNKNLVLTNEGTMSKEQQLSRVSAVIKDNIKGPIFGRNR